MMHFIKCLFVLVDQIQQKAPVTPSWKTISIVQTEQEAEQING